jgi:hypothetical protein
MVKLGITWRFWAMVANVSVVVEKLSDWVRPFWSTYVDVAVVPLWISVSRAYP